MADVDLLLEAERRGILPSDKLEALQEARRRGLVPGALPGAATASAAQEPTWVDPGASSRETYLDARDPTLPERLAGWTGSSPQYWAGVEHNLKAPVRVLEGMKEPFEGVAQMVPHAAESITSLGGYAPNAVSRFFGGVASASDAGFARQNEERQQERAAVGVEPGTPDYSRGIGNALSPATIATGELGLAAKGAGWTTRLGRAALTGGAIGAEQPVYNANGDYWGEKAKQAGVGAATGAGVEMGANIAAPWMTEQAKKLVDRYGIRVPFLSSLGKFPGRIEQISQSVPVSGMATRAQFDQANEDLVRSAYNETLDPVRKFGFGGDRFTPKSAIEPGREMAAHAAQSIEDSYGAVIPRLQSVLDDPFIKEVTRIRASLPERVRPDFDDAVQRNIYNYSELAQAGTAPKAPAKFSTGQTNAAPGWDIQLTLNKGENPGEMAALGRLTKPPAPPKQQAPLDPERAKVHADNLQGSGADPKVFETAMGYLTGDKGVRKGELNQVYQAYTGRAPGSKLTKQDLIDGIQEEFKSRQTQSPHMLNGQNAKNADIGLRDEARGLIQNPGSDQYQRRVGTALTEVRDALRDTWNRHSSPADIEHLKATDLAYRRNMILNRASSSSAAPEGVFGPTQLWQSVKAADPTLGKRATAQGVAELQDLADAAKTVLGKTVADSGTPERGAAMWAAKELGPALAVGGAAMSHALPVAGALGVHALTYTNPVQNALRFMANGGSMDRNALAAFLREKAFAPAVNALTR